MSFQSYPEYKDSGLSWIGAVPSHWTVSRLKHVLAEMGSGGTPDTDDPSMWAEPDDEGTPWVAIGDMSSVDLVLITAKRITARALASKRLKVWPKGTLLFSMYASLGHVAVLGVDAAINQALLALSPNQCSQAFLRHWLSYLQPRLLEQASSNTQDNLNAEKVRGLPVAFPGVDEQLRIAAFLDRETAKIDALVDEQKRLIELLKEKRQAVISQAVTKGLDPNVPMKDSGVEWLGKVPAHWDVLAIWQLFALGRGRVLSHEDIALNEGAYPVYSSQTENEGVMGHISTFDFEGDYLTWTTDGANAGTVFRRSGRFNCTNVCGTLRPKRSSDCLDFLWRAVALSTSSYVRMDINPKLMNNVMSSIRIPVPPSEEQCSIAEWIVELTGPIDPLVEQAGEAICLLAERRSALISAAVTGKIDVRGLAPHPEGAAA